MSQWGHHTREVDEVEGCLPGQGPLPIDAIVRGVGSLLRISLTWGLLAGAKPRTSGGRDEASEERPSCMETGHRGSLTLPLNSNYFLHQDPMAVLGGLSQQRPPPVSLHAAAPGAHSKKVRCAGLLVRLAHPT